MHQGIRSILLVDDNEDVLEAHLLVLERAGYAVKTASNGEEAFVQIRDDRPHLVILDVVMPRMGGLELLLKLRSELAAPLPPIILCSGSDLTEEEALDRGASSFLRKPVTRDDLLAAVAALLERRSP